MQSAPVPQGSQKRQSSPAAWCHHPLISLQLIPSESQHPKLPPDSLSPHSAHLLRVCSCVCKRTGLPLVSPILFAEGSCCTWRSLMRLDWLVSRSQRAACLPTQRCDSMCKLPHQAFPAGSRQAFYQLSHSPASALKF